MLVTTQSVDLDTEVAVDFDCPACGARGRAVVAAAGIGATTTLAGLDEDAARDAALQEARAHAKHQARVTLRLVRCPSCKRRSAFARGTFFLGTMVGTLVLAGCALGSLALIGGWVGIGVGALLGLSTIGFAGLRFRRLTDADSFIRRFELAGPVIPTAIVVKHEPVEPVAPDHSTPRLLH